MKKRYSIAALALAGVLLGASARPGLASEPQPGFSQAELEQMLAHVALYPDELLSQVLMAATYPLEIVEAARWLRSNPGLKGEMAVAAAADEGWAPGVTALLAFPEVLLRMDEDLAWTQRLGDAVLYQEAELMAAIQHLRQRALAAGNLQQVDHLLVRHEQEVIYIEPAQRQIVYVPYYQPAWMYGSWWHPAHPPAYWAPAYLTPAWRLSPVTWSGVGFYWGSGIPVSGSFFFGSVNWHSRHLVLVRQPLYQPRLRPHPRPVYRGYQRWQSSGQRWQHDPRHRRGVSYRRPEAAQKYQRRPGSGSRPAPDFAAADRSGSRFQAPGRVPSRAAERGPGRGRAASGTVEPGLRPARPTTRPDTLPATPPTALSGQRRADVPQRGRLQGDRRARSAQRPEAALSAPRPHSSSAPRRFRPAASSSQAAPTRARPPATAPGPARAARPQTQTGPQRRPDSQPRSNRAADRSLQGRPGVRGPERAAGTRPGAAEGARPRSSGKRQR